MGCLLAIRRDRPDRATYWVLPGGHVDPGDQACGDGRSVGIGAQILKTLRFPSTLGLCRTRRAP
jgi:8-oxo-dGTP pyrophosphatase MutT (NUDIX family)